MSEVMADAIGEIARALADLRRDHEELHRRTSNMIRVGKVKEIDPADPLKVRLDMMPGEGSDPFLSDWVPLAQFGGAGEFQADGSNGNANTFKTSFPTAVGSDVYLISPNGEPGVGFAVPVTYNQSNKPPGTAPDAAVLNFGNAQIRLANGSITMTVDGTTYTMTPDAITSKVGGAETKLTADQFGMKADTVKAEGASLKHNAKEVGDTHGHVTAPPGPPGPPV